MDSNKIIFNFQQFNRLFPFYVLIDNDLKISAFGESMKKICNIHHQDLFSSHFNLSSPNSDITEFNGLKKLVKQMITLEYKNDTILKFSGQFEYFSNLDQLLFVGSPKFESISEVNKNGLMLCDFANHDSKIDLLQTLDAQYVSTGEIQDLLLTVHRQKESLQGINIFTSNMLNQVTLDEIAWTIIDDAMSRFNLTDCVIYLIDEEKQELIQRAAYGLKKKKNHEIYNPIVIKIGDGIVGKVAQTGKATIIGDTSKHPEYIVDDKRRFSELTVPIIAYNKVIGIIDSEHSSKNFFTQRHLTDFTTIANLTAVKIKNALIREKQFLTEKSLEENNKRFEMIVENASEAIYEMNQDGYFTYANPVFFNRMGYALEDLVKLHFWELVEEGHRLCVNEFYKKQLLDKKKESYMEFIAITFDEAPVWISQNVNMRFNSDGSLKDIIVVARDISKRKKIEESLLKKQKMLQGIAEATEELIDNSNFPEAITNSLKILGNAADVDRTYIFENNLNSEGKLITSQKYEWVSEGTSSQISNLDSQNVQLSIFDKYLPQLFNREHFEAIVSELDDNFNLKMILTAQEIKSILIVPVFLQDTFWGFIGYDDCNIEKKWSEDELLLLKSFGNSLSSALKIVSTAKDLKDMALFPLENPDPVVRINLKGEVISINKPGEVLKKMKALGKRKNIEERIYKGLCNRLNTENRIETFEITAKDQVYSATARLSETNEYINIYFSNITKQKEVERALIQSNIQLKQQEEKYRNIISNMNLGLLEIDNDGVVQFCNQGFTEISGFSLDEIKGKEAVKIIFSENDLDHNNNHMLQLNTSDSFEVLTRNKRGMARWWLISHAPNYNDWGSVIGSIGIYLDISQQKQLEVDLERALLKSRKASESKELFLANMSHEIRTPLNGIIGMIRELNKEPQMSNLQKGYLKSAEKASRHLQSIVNNILELTKIEAGQLLLVFEHFSIQELLDDVLSIMKSQADQKQLNLELNLNKNVSDAFIGDKFRIRQILINLVGNALKFTEKGGVQIVCFGLSKTLKKQELCFVVRDTGIGIENKYLSNLFNKFQQEDSSISRKFGGTGLGLYITKQLVDLMNGSLKVKSEKGVGTEIEVCLPLHIGTLSVVPEKEINLSNFALKNKRILLVEDNEINRVVAVNALKVLEVEIVEVENGQKAVDILKRKDFDLILMDIQMPVMSGIEATRVLREELKIETPIVALSANAFKYEIEACLAIGMNDYITKPFEEEDLWRVVSKYLKTSKVTRILKHVEESTTNEATNDLFNLVKLEGMSRGDDKFVKKLVDIFIQTIPENLAQIMRSYEAKDIETINKIAHKIKSSIDTMGIKSLKQDILDLEQFPNQNFDEDVLKNCIDKVSNTLNKVIYELKKHSF